MPRTTFAQVEQDFAKERGRVICTRIHITDAQPVRGRFGFYWEGRTSVGGDLTRWVEVTAVRSPPKLRDSETVEFCGVVTSATCMNGCRGLTHYGVRLVGRFSSASRQRGVDMMAKIRAALYTRWGGIEKCIISLSAQSRTLFDVPLSK